MHSSITRIAGIMEEGPRGPLLREADGTVWKLQLDETLAPVFGQPITVEGVRSGTSIAAYYCGPSSEAPAC